MFSAVFCILSTLFLIMYVIAYVLPKQKTLAHYNKAEEITVIIPFRNEKEHLPDLIESINKLHKFPVKFIFVDDYSEDESAKLLKSLSSTILHELISLKDGQVGKKQAIRKALEKVETDYILTWDADIVVKPNYFVEIEKIPKADLCILPVVMKSRKWTDFFYELDYYFLNAISYSLRKLIKPIVASGANLLIDKAQFLRIDSIKQHQHIASGDDLFTLSDFKKNHLNVQISLLQDVQVTTSTPSNLNEFIHQRVRWAKKTRFVKDYTANFIGFLGLIIQLSFLLAIILASNYLLFLVKIGIEGVILFPYLKHLKRSSLLVFLPFFSLIYPFYLGAMSGFIPILNPTWKNRVQKKEP
jgi:cellulose synthase/poly-beta-1,6-N-acetylglucosamine synthase-like glycosyltransferase